MRKLEKKERKREIEEGRINEEVEKRVRFQSGESGENTKSDNQDNQNQSSGENQNSDNQNLEGYNQVGGSSPSETKNWAPLAEAWWKERKEKEERLKKGKRKAEDEGDQEKMRDIQIDQVTLEKAGEWIDEIRGEVEKHLNLVGSEE